MIRLPKQETKAMVAVHGWSGIVLGLLLYAVVLTGTAAVFAEEIGAWSAGHLRDDSALARPLDRTVRDLAAITPAKYRDDINLFEIGDHRLGAYFHRSELAADGKPTDRGIYYQLDEHGRVAKALHGTGEEVFGPRNDDALSSFLVDTHVRLHLPNPWGLVLTGVLGLAMLVAVISGLLIHRHLFRDVFTLRRGASPALAERDRHSVAGTWSLPFAFVLAFTGSFFSFFGTVGVPVVASAVFGGDIEALSEAVFGAPGKPDPRPHAPGDLDQIMADAARRTGEAPSFVIVEKFGRVDAKVTTFHPPHASALEPTTLLYNGATAAFEQVKPRVGVRPSTGGTLTAIMGPLHFGNFAGVLSKAIWFGLGFAMCYVTYTGMRLWVIRRRAESGALGWLERTLIVTCFGLPFALATAAAAFLVAMPRGTAVAATPGAFLAAAGVAILAGAMVRRSERLAQVLIGAGGVVMTALPLLRLTASGGPGWGEALMANQPAIPALDLAFLLAGLWQINRAWRPVGSRFWPEAVPAEQGARA